MNRFDRQPVRRAFRAWRAKSAVHPTCAAKFPGVTSKQRPRFFVCIRTCWRCASLDLSALLPESSLRKEKGFAIPMQATHDRWMARALELARRAKGATSPNPMVGAVIVSPSGDLIAEGWHEGPGRPHAEAQALASAGERARGATMYVTLEPCSHYGRTPPCAEAIAKSGIAHVVAATQDPNPKVNGRGFELLRGHGIHVTHGVLERDAILLNRAFVTWVKEQRPYVYLKLAQSLDGKVATRVLESKWITGEEARNDGHELRSAVDAIIVGVGTLLADDPLLTARPKGRTPARQPLRVVLDSLARTSVSAKVVRQDPGRTLIAVTGRAASGPLDMLRKAGVQVWVDPTGSERIHVPALLEHLAKRDVTSVLVEGGPSVAGAFYDADCVDEVSAYIAPTLIGGVDALTSLAGAGRAALRDAARLVDVRIEQLGADFKLSGRVPRAFLNDPA